MRSLILGSALALALSAPIPAFAATIPLQDGEYTRGACANGTADIMESIGFYTRTEGPKRGTQFLAPNDEDASGSCSPERMKVSGARYSGRAPCVDGSRQMASGVYDFDIKVVDRRTFVSRGATYRWCAAHR